MSDWEYYEALWKMSRMNRVVLVLSVSFLAIAIILIMK